MTLRCEDLEIGDRVHTIGEHLTAADHDEGRVQDITPDAHLPIMVGWDSGVATPADVGQIAKGERPAEWAEALAAERREGL